MNEMFLQMLLEKGWVAEIELREFRQWLDDRCHDALFNAKDLLRKYTKIFRDRDEDFMDVVNRAICLST